MLDFISVKGVFRLLTGSQGNLTSAKLPRRYLFSRNHRYIQKQVNVAPYAATEKAILCLLRLGDGSC